MFLYYVAAAIAAPEAVEAELPAAPAAANPAPAEAAEIDTEHRRLALQTVDFLWPMGTYQRMMKDMMGPDGMMGAMFDMKLGDMVDVDKAEMSEEDKEIADTTMREAMAGKDPHFEERMRITAEVISEGMGSVIGKLEPAVRDGLANVVAKKFTSAQLRDLNLFFATPTGRFYAAESMTMFMDPELLKSMMSVMPELIKAMPSIEEKLKQATAHLPPPPEEEESSDEETEPTDGAT